MPLVTDISKSNNLLDYVPIITSSVIVDLIVIFITIKYASSIYLKMV